MNNSNSKMPLSRQLRYEKQCRQNWKDNATQKQEKIREYVQANRALKKSRDAWKAKAIEAKKQIKDLEKQVKLLKKQLASSSSSSSSSSQKTTVNYTEETDKTDTFL